MMTKVIELLVKVAAIISGVWDTLNLAQWLVPIVTSWMPRQSEVWLKRYVERLGDKNPQVRLAASRVLVRSGGQAIELLLAAVADRSNRTRSKHAAEALRQIGLLAIRPMIEARHRYLQDDHTDAVILLSNALCQMKTTETLGCLINLLEDTDFGVRQGAIFVLGEVRASQALEVISKVLANQSGERVEVRQEAATALGKIGSPTARPGLINALESDGDWQVRAAAAEALGQIGGHQVIPSLLCALGDDMRVICGAAKALGMVEAREAIDPLIDLLGHAEPGVRQEAATALGNIGSVKAISALLERIRMDDDPGVRHNAADALIQIDTGGATKALGESLSATLNEPKQERQDLILDAWYQIRLGRRQDYAKVETYA